MILVSEENSFHIRHRAFSRPFHAKIFVSRCQRRYFNHTFYRSHYPNGLIACGLCLFSSLASLKIIPLVAPGILSKFFSIDSYRALKIPPRSDRGFFFQGFFKKFLQFHLFLSSHSDFFQKLIYLFRLSLFLL